MPQLPEKLYKETGGGTPPNSHQPPESESAAHVIPTAIYPRGRAGPVNDQPAKHDHASAQQNYQAEISGAGFLPAVFPRSAADAVVLGQQIDQH